jgi:hypothetical protein
MRVDLNLATKPFGRSRLFWTLSAAAGLILGVIAAGLLWSYWQAGRLPPELANREAQLQAELGALSREESEAMASLRAPETVEVYNRSSFLNQLLTRKGISWTRTFGDLEAVLPPRVLVMQVRPEVTFDNKVQLEMQVGAEAPADFIEFLKALESSEVFGSPNLRGYNPPNDNEPYFRYQLMVQYEQQL